MANFFTEVYTFLVEGNLWYMGTLSILFLIILSLSVIAATWVFRSPSGHADKTKKLLGYIKSLALFTLVFGIFGQILNLVDVFDYLAHKDSQVAAPILARGIKITFWPTIYGIAIYLVSILIRLGLKYRMDH